MSFRKASPAIPTLVKGGNHASVFRFTTPGSANRRNSDTGDATTPELDCGDLLDRSRGFWIAETLEDLAQSMSSEGAIGSDCTLRSPINAEVGKPAHPREVPGPGMSLVVEERKRGLRRIGIFFQVLPISVLAGQAVGFATNFRPV